jgi:Fe-S cluster assembly ATPase SufC
MAMKKFMTSTPTPSPPSVPMEWGTRFAPKTFDQICLNKTQATKILQWMQRHQQGLPCPRILVVLGPNGSGKTCATKLAAAHVKFDVVDETVTEKRTKQMVEETMHIMNHATKNTLLLLDNADIANNEVINLIYDMLESNTQKKRKSRYKSNLGSQFHFPIVCISNNMYGSVTKLLERSEVIHYHRVRPDELCKLGTHVLQQQNKTIQEATMHDICRKSQGDVRFFLQTLQMFHASGDTRNIGLKTISETIFEVAVDILERRPSTIEKTLFSMAMDSNQLSCMLFENYTVYCGTIEDAAAAAEKFSLNDRLSSTHQYDLQPYWDLAVGRDAPQNFRKPKVKPKIKYPCIFSKVSLAKTHRGILIKLLALARQQTSNLSREGVLMFIEVALKRIHAGDIEWPLQICQSYEWGASSVDQFPKVHNLQKLPFKQKQKTSIKRWFEESAAKKNSLSPAM